MKRKVDNPPHVLVIGHQRPDTDSAVAAAVYAAMLNQTDATANYEGVVLEDPGPQATWLFETAGIPVPRIIDGVHATVNDIVRRDIRTVTMDAALGDAIRIITEDRISTVPVVNEDGRLVGILSDRLPNCNYFYHFNVEDFLGILFELSDLVRALKLECWRKPKDEAHGKLTMDVAKVARGDILLSRDSTNDLAAAVKNKAAAVIVCTHRSKQEWSRSLRSAGGLGIYRFNGSLLALASQLSMCIPVGNAMEPEPPRLSPDQALQDIHTQVSHSGFALPVVHADGAFAGLVSRTELLDAPKPRVVLVDHFESHQAAPGIEEAEIVEIIDHHRVGALETHAPIRVDCRPVGSTATIIACKFAEAGLKPNRAQARLLLGAMISDTLLLTSPTTTEVDRTHAKALARRAGVKLDEFGREVLVRNDETLSKSPAELLDKDLKEFGSGKLSFAVAQIETVDRSRLKPAKLREFAKATGQRRQREGWDFLCVLITDVLRSDSLVFIDDAKQHRRAHLLGDGKRVGPTTLWPQCVSRKKQFLPTILKRLEELNQ